MITHHRQLRITYLPLGTTAHKQGRIAGENAIGGDIFEVANASCGPEQEPYCYSKIAAICITAPTTTYIMAP